MTIDELLSYAARGLDAAEVDYFITGAMASTFFGRFRTTADIDIVVELGNRQLDALHAQFPDSEFFWQEESARRAIMQRGMFNIIDRGSTLKLDMIVPPHTPFNYARMKRARNYVIGEDKEARFATPEDVILSKLQSYREGESDKHLTDILGILHFSDAPIDHSYVQQWAERLDILDLWQSLLTRFKDE